MSTGSVPYQPISCALHSEYELAILRRTPLNLQWTDQKNQTHRAQLLPINLITRQGEEFLIARNNAAQEFTIRLDTIIE